MQLQVNMWTAFAGRMGIAALLATTLCGVALASGADRAREIELRQLVSGTSYASIRVQLPSGKQRRLVIYGAAAPLVLSAISIDDFGARGYPSVLTIEEARRILAV